MAYIDDFFKLMSMHFGNYNQDSNIGKLMRSITVSDDFFLQTCLDMKAITDLDQATGENLDNIHGVNKNLKRGSLSDSEYVERLKLETKVNNSDGAISTLTDAANVLFGGENFLGINEVFPAGIEINLNFIDTNIPNFTLDRAVAAGIETTYVLHEEQEILNVVTSEPTFSRFINLQSSDKLESAAESGVLF
jgi:hypothetical protein